MEFDRIAAREEHHDLLVRVLLQKGEEQQEALVRGADAVALLEALAGRVLLAVVDTHVDRLALERDPGKVLHLRRMPLLVLSEPTPPSSPKGRERRWRTQGANRPSRCPRLGRLGRREEHRLAVLGQDLDNLAHLLLEADL